MNFTEAAKLKRFIQQNFDVILHIHDTCGGLFVSIDEPNDTVKEFILAFCRENGIPVTVSSDGTAFFPGNKEGVNTEEADRKQEKFFDPLEGADVDVVYVPAGKKSVAYVNKKQVGYCTYYEADGKWVIDHTVVEEIWQNKGIAGLLVQCIVMEARKKGIEVEAVCSYAIKWLQER